MLFIKNYIFMTVFIRDSNTSAHGTTFDPTFCATFNAAIWPAVSATFLPTKQYAFDAAHVAT